MPELTLLIPAKKEAESLPIFLNELKEYNFKILIVLEENDKETINAINQRNNIEILYQKKLVMAVLLLRVLIILVQNIFV